MTPSAESQPHREGKATFDTTGAFYRPKSKIARDLAILAAHLLKQRHHQLRVLDLMTGCGVRPLRYYLEAGADQVWANEANPELGSLIQQNLSVLPRERVNLTHRDAREVCFTCYQRRDFYDLVDIDNFGAPATYTEAGLWAARKDGLLYLTSTDGRSTGGHSPERSLQGFSAYARSHPAVHEQGLRLIIGQAASIAASRGMGVEPVFSLFTGQVHRVMVRLVNKPTISRHTYGFLAYCHGCGRFQTVDWRHLGRVNCGGCGGEPTSTPVVSGPMWLGPLHDAGQVIAMKALASQWGWTSQANLLTVMAGEATLPPYYYPLGTLGRFGKMDIPSRDWLIHALRERGIGPQ